MNLKHKLALKRNYGGYRPTQSIRYIVIHFTANDGDSDEGNANYFANGYRGSSAHYFVDDDSITQSVPDDYIAYSVGGKKQSNHAPLYGVCTNANSLNIEMCDSYKNGKVEITQKTLNNVSELVRYLRKKYNISLENVVRHYDVNGKYCPNCNGFLNDSVWNNFKANNFQYSNVPNTPKYYSKPRAVTWTTTHSRSKIDLNIYDVYEITTTVILRDRPDETSNEIGKRTTGTKINVYDIITYQASDGRMSKWANTNGGYVCLNWRGTSYANLIRAYQPKTIARSNLYYPRFTKNSLVDGLSQINVDFSFANRSKIAKANGISNYRGTAFQNAKLVALGKIGRLKK